MQIFNNEITCYVGETFNLNIKLMNKSGDPYIFNKQVDTLGNSHLSYIVLSIAPTVYTDKDIFRIWVRIDNTDIPQFKYTNIVDVASDKTCVNKPQTTIPSFQGVDGEYYEAREYVFRIVKFGNTDDSPDVGRLVYFPIETELITGDEQTPGTPITAGTNYTAPNLQFAFTRELTEQLGAQSYVYDIRHIICQETANKISENTKLETLKIVYKYVLMPPTKFKVLYPVTEIGGDNIVNS